MSLTPAEKRAFEKNPKEYKKVLSEFLAYAQKPKSPLFMRDENAITSGSWDENTRDTLFQKALGCGAESMSNAEWEGTELSTVPARAPCC